MNRRTKRKIIIIVLLILVLLLLQLWYWNFVRTKKLGLSIAPTSAESIPVPTHLFSFSGTGNTKLIQPIGLAISGDRVFVTDAIINTILEFDTSGRFIKGFKQDKIQRIVYIAVHPTTGNLYVTDRGAKQVHMFSQEGKYLGVFDPKLPKGELAKFDTAGKQWDPTLVAFAPDGTMYAIEVLNGHRLLKFDKNGKFVKSVGNSGFVDSASQAPSIFQFPNGLVVNKGLIYVADSNNRRVQVFDSNLKFKRIIETAGLPRGIDFINRKGIFAKGKDKFVVGDTLSHDGTIWTADGTKLVSFGEQGLLEGQFNYPNALAIDENNRIFMTDTQNSRVQVWGWPASPIPVPPAELRNWAWLCLTPLLLLPLLLLRRKRKFLASRDFVVEIVERERADAMPHKRRQWYVMPDDYEALKDIVQGDVDMGQLLEPVEHSESDAQALQQRLDSSEETAAILSAAQRMYLFCTEDPELRSLAKSLDIQVASVDEFLERYPSESPGDSQTPE